MTLWVIYEDVCVIALYGDGWRGGVGFIVKFGDGKDRFTVYNSNGVQGENLRMALLCNGILEVTVDEF